MAPIIIGPEEKIKIKALIDRATKHPIMIDEIKRRILKGVPGNINLKATISIPTSTVVTYTHEEIKKGVVCRHMSVSTQIKGRVPSVEAVSMIMEEFGFINSIDKVYRYAEQIGDEDKAINVIEPLDGDMSKLFRSKND